MEITGGCLCRAVRYRIAAAPIITRVCWCRNCQYIAAGNGTVNVGFPSAALHIEGEPRDFALTADSGNHMHRRFCANCGTHLFTVAEERPHLVFIRAGTLDDRELARPAVTQWIDSAPSWACFDPALPKVARQAPPVAT
jgi:hypothetical protein